MTGKAMTIAVLAIFLVTFPCWAMGGGGGGGGAGGGAPGTGSPVELLMPHPPRNVTAAPDNGMAIVSFDPPESDGGSPITGYTVTSHPGGITAEGAKSPITVIRLRNGRAYRFTVTATSSVGTGLDSSPSNSVTPQE